jgi:hypothetical protein
MSSDQLTAIVPERAAQVVLLENCHDAATANAVAASCGEMLKVVVGTRRAYNTEFHWHHQRVVMSRRGTALVFV